MAGTYRSEEELKKPHGGGEFPEPAMGIPYGYPPPSGPNPAYGYGQQSQGQPMYQNPHIMYQQQPVMQAPPQQSVNYHPNTNPHQAGMIPSNALFGPPNGIPIRETFFADTPAPFECPNCGKSGMTQVKSIPSLAACVACMMTVVGVCFLFKSCDCLWHKEHYCQDCNQKVADYRKSDPCLVVDVPQWSKESFAVPS